MYKVYLIKQIRKGQSELVHGSKTDTHSFAVASVAFWELRKNTEYEDKKFVLLMTQDHKKVNAHNFMNTEGGDSFTPLDGELKRG